MNIQNLKWLIVQIEDHIQKYDSLTLQLRLSRAEKNELEKHFKIGYLTGRNYRFTKLDVKNTI